MTLLDVVRQLDELPDTDEDEETPFVIYAARKDGHWTADSPAVVLAPPDDDVVQVVEGVEYRYLLEGICSAAASSAGPCSRGWIAGW
jgi:hypothetical protein